MAVPPMTRGFEVQLPGGFDSLLTRNAGARENLPFGRGQRMAIPPTRRWRGQITCRLAADRPSLRSDRAGKSCAGLESDHLMCAHPSAPKTQIALSKKARASDQVESKIQPDRIKLLAKITLEHDRCLQRSCSKPLPAGKLTGLWGDQAVAKFAGLKVVTSRGEISSGVGSPMGRTMRASRSASVSG